MKNWLVAIALFLASACTTIEDFQAMSPDERADEVCSASAAARQRRSVLQGLNNQIFMQEELLSTGYRLYQKCEVLPVRFPPTVADCTGLEGDNLANCQRKNTPARVEHRRVCREIAVPIDYSYEGTMLRNLQIAKDEQLAMHELETEVCLAKARLLPANDAYLLYQNNADP